MKHILITSALLTGCFLSGAASAMTMPELNRPATGRSAVLIDYACGPGWHLSQWNDCRPNYTRPPPRYVYHRNYYGWYGPPGWRDRGPPPGWRHHDREDDDWGD